MSAAITLAGVSVILCVLFFIYFRGYIKRKTAPDVLLADYRNEVFRLIAEIDAATDRDALLVEERIKTLKNILADTDKRISVYLRDLERGRTAETLYTNLGRVPRPGNAVPAPSAGESPAVERVPEVHAGSGTVPASPPAAPGIPPEIPLSATPSVPAASGKNKNLRLQIAELAVQGLPTPEIASRLGISLSEVDLALSLFAKSG